MKNKIIWLIILFSHPLITVFSQKDSTTLYYKGIENEELRIICSLADIQVQKIFCKDTSLQGKVFNFIIKEFKEGKVHSEQNLNIVGEQRRIPMFVNGDSVTYIIDYTDKTGFGKSTDSLLITFAGILQKEQFKLTIEYPGISVSQLLHGESNYSLRPANSCSGNEIRVPLNTEYPILTYTPPLNTGSQIHSYCLLGEENIADWYEKFKIEHYYVIYIEIK